jgi:3-isopropylmalate/(R)-2-methylmalate dehydratase small subunit
MEKFTVLEGIAAPIMRINIDTDVIIPSREMKRVSKEGLSDGMFSNWRYTEPGGREENPDFILNQEPYRQASILLSGDNFGCGSSREHAVWAMAEWGIRCIITPGFGNIFYGNCVLNGILPVVLENDVVEDLARQVEANPANNLIKVNLK